MRCRFCDNELKHEFIDLNHSPLSNEYLRLNALNQPEVYYPLKIFVCDHCFLVQIDEYKTSGEIFNKEYAYFSSVSSSWLAHSKKYVEMIIPRLNLGRDSLITEIACNDGYLLQYFLQKKIPCLGVEPTKSTADAAREKGISIIEDFFGTALAKRLEKSDLIIGNNVLAHVPDINDFVQGLAIGLKAGGTITLEFPHLLNLMRYRQFDTIYHEHFSYFSLYTVLKIFTRNRLVIYDVEELPTHGGSLRLFAGHAGEDFYVKSRVKDLLQEEKDAGLHRISGYCGLQSEAKKIKMGFLSFLLSAQKEGKRVAAYGAAAKGNTLLNYCGVKNDLIDFVVDASPSKQGQFLPGSHLPIVDESELMNLKPDYVIIFPWNIKEEIMDQLQYVKSWGCRFVIAIPEIKVI